MFLLTHDIFGENFSNNLANRSLLGPCFVKVTAWVRKNQMDDHTTQLKSSFFNRYQELQY